MTTYEIEFKEGGVDSAAVFSAAGDLMELERSTPAAKLPAAVTAALARKFPGAAIQRPMSVTRMFYEVHVTIDGKPREIKVDPSGAIADHADAKHEDQDKDEKKPAAAGAPADPTDDFRKTFAVEKSALGPTGASPYFDLTPGVVSTFKDGKTTLAITVLNETRVLDGVTTRVVEEREEVAGKPKETSRNYFAIDKASSDVYYFGEDVDEFDADGKATHPGVWHAGEHGARFGLMIPGAPKVGDKFYQELAPGLAMDRFEIVGVDDTIQTPAGKFEHCVHVVETTPLENDVGHKWYAPGTGLVKDGKAELVSIKRPGK